jgi:pimeloyl-ACP methyl ester carboxylesterase
MSSAIFGVPLLPMGFILVFLFTTISLYFGISSVSSAPLYDENPSIPGRIIQIPTQLGMISVRMIGNPGKKPIICLPGINPKLVDEWTIVGEPISQKGFVVYIINFHSNSKTVPALFLRGISKLGVVDVINDVMSHLKVDQVILMGKSWGGEQAMSYAKEFPNKVQKLCLIAPASSSPSVIKQLEQNSLPIYLGWAKDDPSVWYSKCETWKRILGSKLTFQSADSGGHRILLEYAQNIINFLDQK